MGWTSTGDPYANVGDAGLGFVSEEAAKSFAERHGWDYVVCAISFRKIATVRDIFMVFDSKILSNLIISMFILILLLLSHAYLVFTYVCV